MKSFLFIVTAFAFVSLAQNQTQTPSPAMQEANALMQAQKWAEAAKAFEK
jgi:hypothetical protein